MKKFVSLVIAVIVILSTVLLGCSTANPIVGTWAKLDRDGNISKQIMYFYDDGTCLDTPVKTITSADAVSYNLQDDGMLIFTMEWDGTCVYERTEDKELALDDRGYYYLSGDTFVLCKQEYVKQ